MKPTNVPQFISELGAGVVEEKLAHMISEVATQVVALDKMGEITLNIKLKKLGDSDQLKVEHKLAYKRPKKRGSISEDDTQESMMWVNEGGNVTQFPENQLDMIGKGEVQHAD